MSLEVNIFTLVLIIIILVLLYWIYLDNSEKIEQRKVASVEKSTLERKEWNSPDYSSKLSFFGLIMGGWIGYLFRPTVKILGTEIQIPFSKIIDVLLGNHRDDSTPLESIAGKLTEEYAYISIEYVITGAILGAAVGWVVGKLIKR